MERHVSGGKFRSWRLVRKNATLLKKQFIYIFFENELINISFIPGIRYFLREYFCSILGYVIWLVGKSSGSVPPWVEVGVGKQSRRPCCPCS